MKKLVAALVLALTAMLTVAPQAFALGDSETEAYRTITPRALALIVKNPDAHKAEKLVVYGAVTQADQNLGDSAIRVNVAATPGTYWFDFDHNSFATNPDKPEMFANVVEDDIVKMNVRVIGTFEYEARFGLMEVPLFVVDEIAVIGSV